LNIQKKINNIQFIGNSEKKGDFYLVKGKITGTLEVKCIKCLNTYERKVDEEVKYKIVKPPYHGFDDEYDIIEQENFDLNEILKSEIESFKLDYNICEKCRNKEFNKEF
jgi:uncharacterized metal-binding protein YceD (DUF177 family)